jgi:hypothetical protein
MDHTIPTPKFEGVLPMKWKPWKFSELFGVRTTVLRSKSFYNSTDHLIRQDVAIELSTDPLGFFRLENEQALRDKHPEFEEFYQNIFLNKAGPKRRTMTHIGFSDIPYYLSSYDVTALFNIDDPELFWKVLKMAHFNCGAPILRDLFMTHSWAYRRELVHILTCPSTPRELLRHIITEKFSLKEVCDERGISDIYPWMDEG